MASPTVSDLAGVIYSSGKVFDGLTSGRLDTESFLILGDPGKLASRQDLLLLQDLKAVAVFIIDHAHEPMTAELLRRINSEMTRSASMEPGMLRLPEQNIGVSTPFGRHEPPAIGDDELNAIITQSLEHPTPEEQAVSLFISVAKAQPFLDGNKRTGLFAANALLINDNTQTVLTVPVADDDPSLARDFNLLLARAYIHGKMEPVTAMLLDLGINPLPAVSGTSAEELAKVEEFKAAIAERAAKASREQ